MITAAFRIPSTVIKTSVYGSRSKLDPYLATLWIRIRILNMDPDQHNLNKKDSDDTDRLKFTDLIQSIIRKGIYVIICVRIVC